VVSLHGYAQVFKNPNTPGDAYKNYSATIGSGKAKSTGSYFGNGFVSLFEDEVVLCGEGRLAEGVYHFNFELEFPSKGLPSSIDFERGTVAYMLTATLTRPTTISPTTTDDTKVHLVESIDIATVAVPKPRVISLEPISRRSRAKTPKPRPDTAVSAAPPKTAIPDAPGKPRTSGSHGTPEDSEPPRSPSPSDVSFDSRMSSGASGTEYGVRSVHTTQDSYSAQNGSRATLKGKTITATIDVLKGGFLRGDQIPIKVTINHTKHVRSLKGIILTLYRQARVDMHPALPVVANSKGDKKKTEDYYPKSRTGLGGLSLSSAGSSHLFRKDLSQSFAPLFVDPRTLTAEVKCSVRVPDDVFPTISNVPGAMISFRYYVEVVVDIQGKLTGLDRLIANAGLVNVPSTSAGTPGATQNDATGSMFSTWGGNFVDTDQLRREKGVVTSLFEVIVGTIDSERNGKRKQTHIHHDPNGVHDIPVDSGHDTNGNGEYDPGYYDYDENGQYYDYNYDSTYYDAPGYDQYNNGAQPSYQPPAAPTAANEGLSEKERMRRAEALLLPSQPPDVGPSASPSVVPHGIPPSAPVLPEDDELRTSHFTTGAAGSSSSQHTARPPPPFHATSLPSTITHTDTVPPMHRRFTELPDDDGRGSIAESSRTIHAITQQNPEDSSKPLPPIPPQSPATIISSGPAPEYFPPSSSHVQPTDDKEEMQRRRLEMERSAPPEDLDEESGPSQHLRPSAPPPVDQLRNMRLAPSAPVLDEDDEGLVDAMRGAGSGGSSSHRPVSEALPKYHR